MRESEDARAVMDATAVAGRWRHRKVGCVWEYRGGRGQEGARTKYRRLARAAIVRSGSDRKVAKRHRGTKESRAGPQAAVASRRKCRAELHASAGEEARRRVRKRRRITARSRRGGRSDCQRHALRGEVCGVLDLGRRSNTIYFEGLAACNQSATSRPQPRVPAPEFAKRLLGSHCVVDSPGRRGGP